MCFLYLLNGKIENAAILIKDNGLIDFDPEKSISQIVINFFSVLFAISDPDVCKYYKDRFTHYACEKKRLAVEREKIIRNEKKLLINERKNLIKREEKNLEQRLRELYSEKNSLEETLFSLEYCSAAKKQYKGRLKKCCVSISELESLLSMAKQKKQEIIEEKISFNKTEFSTSSKAEETNINRELLLVPNANSQYNEGDYYTVQEIISHWPLSQEDVIKQAMIANEILSVCSIS